MDKKKIESLKTFAQRKSELPEWREFKAKWCNGAPRKNSKAFAEYAEDCRRADVAIQSLANEMFVAVPVSV